jgi:hypothetical protein
MNSQEKTRKTRREGEEDGIKTRPRRKASAEISQREYEDKGKKCMQYQQ